MRKDFLTRAERSRRMSLIRGKGTKCEKAMARLLRANGIRYSSQRRGLAGCPDFCLRNTLVVIFVDGAYWHGRKFDAWKSKLKPFWLEKIHGNIRRDRKVNRALRRQGWVVLRIWEEDVYRRGEWCLNRVRRAIRRASLRIDAPQ